ncbi:MAG: hypothetical protein AMJ91_06485 [candidate division Zixibacteria bacterium SM23_73_3]|nr:MAG: hypothetical protein AMJ91_06485 [candidate division Zixibacteria bacterium SM23_73_3]
MRAKLLIALLSLTFFVAFSGLAFAQFGSISGSVTDETTGQPITGAAITLSGIYCVWYTDTSGYYTCDSVPAGAYIVNAYATGYFPQTYPDSVIVIQGQNTPHIDFALTPTGGGTGSISGRVTDEVTGLPIAGAGITLSDLDCDCVWFTDSTGHYICDYLPPGVYEVYASAAGYHPETYPESVIVVEGQNTPNIDFALTPVAEYGLITGQVIDEQTGLPIIMARLRAIGLDNPCFGEAFSDTGGWYGILHLCPGIYQVVASKEGYAPEVYPDSVIVVAGENTQHIDFALAPISEYGSISGMVIDEETGFPISMAHLVAIGLDNWCFAEAWSDTDGYYIFPHLCPGIYQVSANAQGYIPATYPDSVTVIAGQNTPDIDFALIPEGGPEFGSISGRVTDEQTGLPIVMAEITITGIYCIWYTDTAGYYLCHPLPPDSYEVNVRRDGYIPETYPDSVIVIGGQNTPGIDFALTPTGEYGTISGRVTDEETGLPIIMAHLVAIGLDNWCYGEAWSDTSGHYMIQNLCPGIYQVNANKMGYVPETYLDSVTVIAGENTPDIDFTLMPIREPGSISGLITDANTGEPIPGACVWAYGEFGHSQAHTDSLGEYTISGLYPGDYFVTAWAWDYYSQDYPTVVTVIEGQDTPGIDFALIPYGGPGEGIIAGSVFEDSMFSPISFAIVFAVSWNGNWGFDFADSVGAYMIQGLQTDDYYVFAIAPGYVGEFYDGVYTWEEATLVTPDAYDIDFHLAPCGSGGGRISGVISSDGSPVEGAFVYAQVDGEIKGFARSSTQGGYVIDGLLSGTYTVFASKVSYLDGLYPDPVEVGYGKVSGIDIDLPPAQIGDVSGDGLINIEDILFIVNYLYKDGPAPYYLMVGDCNCDEVVDLGDVLYLISYLYKGGQLPGNP